MRLPVLEKKRKVYDARRHEGSLCTQEQPETLYLCYTMYTVLHTLGSLTASPVVVYQLSVRGVLLQCTNPPVIPILHSDTSVSLLCDVSLFSCCTVLMFNYSSVTPHLCTVFAQSDSSSVAWCAVLLFYGQVHPLHFTSHAIASLDTSHLTAGFSTWPSFGTCQQWLLIAHD